MGDQPGRAKRHIATAEFVGRTCPYCRFPLKQGGEVVQCGYCQAAHHADCWDDNGGCAVIACAGGPGKAQGEPPTATMPVAGSPAATFTPPPMQPQWTPPQAPQSPPPPPNQPGRGLSSTGLVAALLVLAFAIGGVGVALILAKSSGGSTASTNGSAPVAQTTRTPATPGAALTPTVSVTTHTTMKVVTVYQGTSSPSSSSSSSSSGNSGSALASSGGSAAALGQYWNDVNSGNYAGATSMETASEHSKDPESNMEAEAPGINVISIGTPSSDSGEADVPIDFWAQDTQPTSFSDENCRHFTMNAVMVQNSDGSWSYDGPEPGTTNVSVENGNSNCP